MKVGSVLDDTFDFGQATGKERVNRGGGFGPLFCVKHGRALTPVTCHMSSDATCSVLHKFKSGLGADTGECHASHCYRDTSPSVRSGTRTHTHMHADAHWTADSKETLSETPREVER